jgi:hypothetical protein
MVQRSQNYPISHLGAFFAPQKTQACRGLAQTAKRFELGVLRLAQNSLAYQRVYPIANPQCG